MSSINNFEDDHSKLNGGTKITASLKEGTQTPVADIEMPLRVEADQELSSKGRDDRALNLEPTKDDVRAPNRGKEAHQRAKGQGAVVEESNLSSMKEPDDSKLEVSQTSEKLWVRY